MQNMDAWYLKYKDLQFIEVQELHRGIDIVLTDFAMSINLQYIVQHYVNCSAKN